MKSFVGYLLVSIGLLILTLSGGCTVYALASGVRITGLYDLFIVGCFAGPPTLLAIVLLKVGMSLAKNPSKKQ